jgi:hypothetical protein
MQIIRASREARFLEAKFGDAYRQYRYHRLTFQSSREKCKLRNSGLAREG